MTAVLQIGLAAAFVAIVALAWREQRRLEEKEREELKRIARRREWQRQ